MRRFDSFCTFAFARDRFSEFVIPAAPQVVALSRLPVLRRRLRLFTSSINIYERKPKEFIMTVRQLADHIAL